MRSQRSRSERYLMHDLCRVRVVWIAYKVLGIGTAQGWEMGNPQAEETSSTASRADKDKDKDKDKQGSTEGSARRCTQS